MSARSFGKHRLPCAAGRTETKLKDRQKDKDIKAGRQE